MLTSLSFAFFIVTASQQQRRCDISLHKHSFSRGPSTDAKNVIGEHQSRWQRRTEKRRKRTEDLLDSIEVATLSLLPKQPSIELRNLHISTLRIPQASAIDWESIDPELDPVRGGELQQGTQRALRKRSQVQAFHFVVSTILKAHNKMNGVTIIDAGCGAGNLAISLAGLPYTGNMNINVLAVDVNNHALERLSKRAQAILPPEKLVTCCADLADYDSIRSKIPPNHSVIVVSLHACGAASDMAMNLAFRCNAPFVICPCCTAKSLTKRLSKDTAKKTTFDLSASFQRSGASSDIEYPRSKWLRNKLHDDSTMALEEKYTLLSKIADVGLGPQTQTQQRHQQSRAKKIIELDRLLAASEGYGYAVRLMRISDHDPLVYGKGDLLIGGKGAEAVLSNFPEENFI